MKNSIKFYFIVLFLISLSGCALDYSGTLPPTRYYYDYYPYYYGYPYYFHNYPYHYRYYYNKPNPPRHNPPPRPSRPGRITPKNQNYYGPRH